MDTSIPCCSQRSLESVRVEHLRGHEPVEGHKPIRHRIVQPVLVYNECRDAHSDLREDRLRPAKVTHVLALRQAAPLWCLGLRPVGFHPPTEVRLSVVQATCPCPRCRQQGMRPHAVLHRLDLALERPSWMPGQQHVRIQEAQFAQRFKCDFRNIWVVGIANHERTTVGRPGRQGRRRCTCVRRPPRW